MKLIHFFRTSKVLVLSLSVMSVHHLGAMYDPFGDAAPDDNGAAVAQRNVRENETPEQRRQRMLAAIAARRNSIQDAPRNAGDSHTSTQKNREQLDRGEQAQRAADAMAARRAEMPVTVREHAPVVTGIKTDDSRLKKLVLEESRQRNAIFQTWNSGNSVIARQIEDSRKQPQRKRFGARQGASRFGNAVSQRPGVPAGGEEEGSELGGLMDDMREALVTAANAALGLLGGDPLCTVEQFSLLCLSYGVVFTGCDKDGVSVDVNMLREKYSGKTQSGLYYEVIDEITGGDEQAKNHLVYRVLQDIDVVATFGMRMRLVPSKAVKINDWFTYDPRRIAFSNQNQDGLKVFQAQNLQQSEYDCPAFALFNAAVHARTLDFKSTVMDIRDRYQGFYDSCMYALGAEHPQSLHEGDVRRMIDGVHELLPPHIVVVPWYDVFDYSENEALMAAKLAECDEHINPALARFKAESTQQGDSLYCITNTAASGDAVFAEEDNEYRSHWICVVFTRDSSCPEGFFVEVRDSLNKNFTGLPLYKTIVDQLNS